MEQQDIKELDLDRLSQWLTAKGVAPYRAGQILRWVYLRQANAFEEMTDIGKDLRAKLDQGFRIQRLGRQDVRVSRDGSRKYLFTLDDGHRIESVLIPERDHYTLCISTQVGCAQGCRFCATGGIGFIRNLTRGEIVAQVRDILYDIEHLVPPDPPRRLTNLVFMGMGEPLANYTHLHGAIQTLTDNHAGLMFANRRVTVSTAGIVPKIEALGRDTKVNLAISLNATDNATRSRLMPINRTYSIEDLLAACRRYPLPPTRRITVEYILMRDVNDTRTDARRLVKLLGPLKAKINLIPFNEHDRSDFRRPSEERILDFQKILLAARFTVIIRRSKGEDIAAACGQLAARQNP